MTQYLLSLPHDTEESPTLATMDPAEAEAALAAAGAFMEELVTAGVLVFAGGLYPPSTAITVDHTGDAPVHTEGPFVEAPEYLGGLWVVEAATHEDALAWADKAAKAMSARVELRAFQEVPAEA
jgi:hypothetical protein